MKSIIFIKQYIIILAVVGLLQSCSSMYIPAVRSIPLFEEKGEFQGEAGISTNSIYANASCAITNKIAVSVNGNLSFRNFSNRYDLFTDIYQPPPTTSGWLGWFTPDLRGSFAHRYGEVSAGRINILPNFLMKLEVFGGAGMGRATDIDRFENDNEYKVDYYSFFGQGNLGFKKRSLEAGASLRLAYSRFNCVANLHEEADEHRKIDVCHVEPMFFARVGKGNVKAVFRVGVNIPFDPNKESILFYRCDYTIFHLSMGVSYRIMGKKPLKN
jgi:hypothetical protein